MTDCRNGLKGVVARFICASMCAVVSASAQPEGRAAEIVGPPPPSGTQSGTRVVQGEPPLIRLMLRGDDGQPLQGMIVKWDGPIGGGRIAEECDGALHVSTAVPGTYEFIAVVAPAAVSGPDDLQIIHHPLVVEPRGVTPPRDPPSLPPNPPPSGAPADLTSQARDWLKTVPESARGRARDVAQTLREIGRSNSIRTIDEMELFLRLGLAWSIGDDADAWAAFSASANRALDALKRGGATPQQYAQALLKIADGIDS